MIIAPHLPFAAAPLSFAAVRPGHLRTAEPVPPVPPVPPVVKLFGDAEGLLGRRRAGLGTDGETRQDRRTAVPRPLSGHVFATSAYVSQAMAQDLDPQPEPATPHRQGVAAYPSLTLDVEVFAPGDPASSSVHIVDFLA